MMLIIQWVESVWTGLVQRHYARNYDQTQEFGLFQADTVTDSVGHAEENVRKGCERTSAATSGGDAAEH
jgi:hypothetical protein